MREERCRFVPSVKPDHWRAARALCGRDAERLAEGARKSLVKEDHNFRKLAFIQLTAVCAVPEINTIGSLRVYTHWAPHDILARFAYVGAAHEEHFARGAVRRTGCSAAGDEAS